MMGVPLYGGPAALRVENESVVNNSSIPESTFKYKHILICYNLVRESSNAEILKTFHIKPEDNCADCLANNIRVQEIRTANQQILYEYTASYPNGNEIV